MRLNYVTFHIKLQEYRVRSCNKDKDFPKGKSGYKGYIWVNVAFYFNFFQPFSSFPNVSVSEMYEPKIFPAYLLFKKYGGGALKFSVYIIIMLLIIYFIFISCIIYNKSTRLYFVWSIILY